MAIKEQDVVFVAKDTSGNKVIQMPITRVGNVEGAIKTVNKVAPDASGNVAINTVANAIKATQDASGNVITSTYATKSEVSSKYATKEELKNVGGGEDCLKTTGGVFNGTTEFSPATGDTPASVGTEFYIGEGNALSIATRNYTEDKLAGIALMKNDDVGGDVATVASSASTEDGVLSGQIVAAPGLAGFVCQAGELRNVLILSTDSYVPQTTMGPVVTSVNGQHANDFGQVTVTASVPTATSTTLGGVKTGSNITNLNGTISLTETNVTNALGFRPVATSGARGSLAGYETSGNSTTINASAPDSNQTGSNITVQNGSSGTSWTKVVQVTSAVSVTLGSSWKWVGGSAPTIKSGGILVCCWCGSGGIANFASPS